MGLLSSRSIKVNTLSDKYCEERDFYFYLGSALQHFLSWCLVRIRGSLLALLLTRHLLSRIITITIMIHHWLILPNILLLPLLQLYPLLILTI